MEYRCCCFPSLLSPQAEPSTWVFVIFYGLDWVATVPPTIVLCRNYFGTRSPVVFGWVFASHQLGAAIAAAGAGRLRDLQGNYDMAFYLAAGLCFVAAVLVRQMCEKCRSAHLQREFGEVTRLWRSVIAAFNMPCGSDELRSRN